MVPNLQNQITGVCWTNNRQLHMTLSPKCRLALPPYTSMPQKLTVLPSLNGQFSHLEMSIWNNLIGLWQNPNATLLWIALIIGFSLLQGNIGGGFWETRHNWVVSPSTTYAITSCFFAFQLWTKPTFADTKGHCF